LSEFTLQFSIILLLVDSDIAMILSAFLMAYLMAIKKCTFADSEIGFARYSFKECRSYTVITLLVFKKNGSFSWGIKTASYFPFINSFY